MKLSVAFVALICAVLVSAQSLNPPVEYGGNTNEADNTPPSSFSYQNHGTDWTGTCSSGKHQSPIDIPFNATKVNINRHKGSEVALDFFYKSVSTDVCRGVNVTMVNNGHSLEVDGDFGHVLFGCGSCERPKYHATALVFHSPSEHSIDGKFFDLEMQIVHQKEGASGNDGLLIVSLLFRNKTTPGGNPFLQHLDWKNSPANSGQSNVLQACLNLNSLDYSIGGDYYNYPGSMTTPPCEESVIWNVMVTPQGISDREIRKISSIFNTGNTRAEQGLHGREVLYVKRHPEVHKVKYD